MFWINLSLELYDLSLNLQLGRNANFPLITHFTFSNVILKNQKSKKQMTMYESDLGLTLFCAKSAGR